jgi:hypothetical protein
MLIATKKVQTHWLEVGAVVLGGECMSFLSFLFFAAGLHRLTCLGLGLFSFLLYHGCAQNQNLYCWCNAVVSGRAKRCAGHTLLA